jgi:hypothetical protein
VRKRKADETSFSLKALHFVLYLYQMNFTTYCDYFQGILDDPDRKAPYDNPEYIDYTRMNWARMNRWLKTAVISDSMRQAIAAIDQPQQWIIITEPWCGDAAHCVPLIHMIAAVNPHITVRYELRDAAPHRIDKYLTRGGKSIPKLIIQDTHGSDLATWGPRPAACQLLYDRLMENKADFETVKMELQRWYNDDKGRGVQQELEALVKQVFSSTQI